MNKKYKYMIYPERLQGTDGIRGRVLKSSEPEVSGLSPLEVFVKKGIITEQFIELYTYCFVSLLMKKKIAKKGEEIAIGWDPRDKEGIFTDAAIRGIRRGGGCAAILGIIPTPALPLYMTYRGICAGVMITASHNPSDQNGVKLFLYPPGIKFFPEDDKLLTDGISKIYYEDIKSKKLAGGLKNRHSECIKVFLDFICDRRNSWVKNKNLLKNRILIVDSANGSYSEIAFHTFKRLGFENVIDVGNDLKREVNQNCGVSDLEGISRVLPSMVFKNECNGFPKFAENITLKKIFKTGRIYRGKILKNKAFVSGAVFDADGDRFFMLEYDALKDEVIVLTGDDTASIQGRYLINERCDDFKNSYYTNTVESDIQASLSAREMGFRIKTTGVGDKWILANSMIEILNLFIRFISKKNVKKKIRIDEIKNAFVQIKNLESISAFKMADTFKKINSLRKVLGEYEFNRWIKEIPSCHAVGSEESGHNITAGYLEDCHGKLYPVFTGNGLKSAINTFVSVLSLSSGGKYSYNRYIRFLRSPFRSGIKKSLYVYYTDKKKFFNGSKEWKDIRKFTEGLIEKKFRGRIKLKNEIKKEEPSLLYFSLINSDGNIRGAVFVRNSGTEDKTGVGVRGRKGDERILSEIGEEIAGFLRKVLKDYQNPCAKIQRLILEKVSQNKKIEKSLLISFISENTKSSPEIIKRVLMETEKKESLIRRVIKKGSEEDFYSITDRGRLWLG